MVSAPKQWSAPTPLFVPNQPVSAASWTPLWVSGMPCLSETRCCYHQDDPLAPVVRRSEPRNQGQSKKDVWWRNESRGFQVDQLVNCQENWYEPLATTISHHEHCQPSLSIILHFSWASPKHPMIYSAKHGLRTLWYIGGCTDHQSTGGDHRSHLIHDVNNCSQWLVMLVNNRGWRYVSERWIVLVDHGWWMLMMHMVVS